MWGVGDRGARGLGRREKKIVIWRGVAGGGGAVGGGEGRWG